MQALIETNREAISDLCRRFRVRRLELYGSAVNEAFDPQASDIDFLVSFEEVPLGQYADNYFGLLEELEKLLQRPVDLVVSSAITNPYFLQGIASTRTVLYAA